MTAFLYSRGPRKFSASLMDLPMSTIRFFTYASMSLTSCFNAPTAWAFRLCVFLFRGSPKRNSRRSGTLRPEAQPKRQESNGGTSIKRLLHPNGFFLLTRPSSFLDGSDFIGKGNHSRAGGDAALGKKRGTSGIQNVAQVLSRIHLTPITTIR